MYDYITITVSGASGNETSERPITGRVIDVHYAFTNGHANTDCTLETIGKSHPAKTLLTTTNYNTSGWLRPRLPVHDETGAAATLDGTRAMREAAAIDDYVKLTVAQNNANGVVVATIMVECGDMH